MPGFSLVFMLRAFLWLFTRTFTKNTNQYSLKSGSFSVSFFPIWNVSKKLVTNLIYLFHNLTKLVFVKSNWKTKYCCKLGIKQRQVICCTFSESGTSSIFQRPVSSLVQFTLTVRMPLTWPLPLSTNSWNKTIVSLICATKILLKQIYALN